MKKNWIWKTISFYIIVIIYLLVIHLMLSGVKYHIMSNEERSENNELQTILKYFFNCCFTVHFDKYKTILPTNALFY